jgi:hypothetical protein
VGARRAIRITNEVLNIKPFVVLVARVMPPGRRRLEMVKLAHELDHSLDAIDSSRPAV